MAQYEFSEAQNQQIGGLAGKMRSSACSAVVLGVINIIMALLVIVAILPQPGFPRRGSSSCRPSRRTNSLSVTNETRGKLCGPTWEPTQVRRSTLGSGAVHTDDWTGGSGSPGVWNQLDR